VWVITYITKKKTIKGGAGILSQSHGSATIRGPDVGVIGCLGEASLLVGTNASLEAGNCISVHNSRGHGLLAHAGAAVSVELTHFDDVKQCGVCCRGDGTNVKLDSVCISRSRQATISSGDRARVSLSGESTFVVTSVGGDKSTKQQPDNIVEEVSGGRVEFA
jgi:hypothetical protein